MQLDATQALREPHGQHLRVLFVEDDLNDVLLVLRQLQRSGYTLTHTQVTDRMTMVRALEAGVFDIILADHTLPGFSAPEALAIYRGFGRDIPFIVVSGSIGEETAVRLVKEGAHDYIMKDNLGRLALAIDRELREARLRQERQQLEEELRQAQRLEALGRVVGSVAHDFNNYLSVIQGFAYLLREKADPETLRSVEQIDKASQKATRLIGQLLAFGRRQQLEPKRIDLTAMLQDQLLILQKLVGDRVCVHTEFCPEECWVQADPSRLDQVVLNLVANARDAMPKGGQLWLATRRVALEPAGAARLGLEQGSFVQLIVRDDGHGMDEHTRDHLFEPFFTTKEPEHGTGLGLATVYGVVRQSGGAIEVQSSVSQGSTFTIWLPQAD